MNRLQPIFLLLSFGLAFGTNRLMRTELDYELTPGERTLATGSLRFDQSAASLEMKLATVHVFAGEIRRPFKDPQSVRELWIRSPEQDGQSAPDLELFFDLPPNEAHAVAVLEQRELRVQAKAPGSRLHSRLRLPGSDRSVDVREGTLVLDEILPSDVAGSFRVEGKLELFVPDGDGERRLHANLSARVVSD